MARILVVEDEHVVAHDLAQIVSLLGHELSGVATTGEEAVRKAADTEPELMLMDVRLKGDVDGIEAARRIRERRDVPVVFLTAFGDEQTISDARAAEPSGYLIKPYSEREINGAIEIALHKHRLEQALKARERFFFTTLSAIGDAVVATDARRRVSYVNPAAEVLLGESAAVLMGEPVDDVVHLVGEPQPLGRRRLARRDGAERLVEASVTRLPDGEVHVLRDVTDRRALETRLAVSERLASLGTLTAGIAHEINNPLAFDLANQTFALEELPRVRESLAKVGDSPALAEIASRLRTVEEALSEAKDGAERVRGIVRDLRTFARGDAEERRVIDLSRAVEQGVRLASGDVGRRARLVRVATTNARVVGNEKQLAQVVSNLLVNAAQAIEKGAPDENEVRLSVRLDANGDALIDVEDTGRGIPPEVAPRIFDPFFTTRPVGGGTGLGLSIVHGIVRAHGGELSVDTSRPVGASVRVRLPTVREAPPAPQERAVRVLVIDDEPLVGSAVKRLLGREHDVQAVTSVGEALALFENDRAFDVVLCDLMLPGRSGPKLEADLRRHWPELADRFTFITGGAFAADEQAFVDLHPERVLAKPFDRAALEALVRAAAREA